MSALSMSFFLIFDNSKDQLHSSTEIHSLPKFADFEWFLLPANGLKEKVFFRAIHSCNPLPPFNCQLLL